MELILYYDEGYGSSWVPKDVSQRISDYLKGKGFQVYDAEKLKGWMIEKVDNETCYNSLVVFSQDVIPDIMCPNAYSNSLICAYLDSGGTVVWIGDIPFYYEGCCPSSQEKLRNEYANVDLEKDWKKQAPNGKIDQHPDVNRDSYKRYFKAIGRRGSFNALGVVPVWLEHSEDPVSITTYGEKCGLKTPWHGARPILIKGLSRKGPIILAKSKPRYIISQEKSFLDEEKESRFSIGDFIFRIINAIPPIVAGITALTAGIVLYPSLGTAIILPLIIATGTILFGNFLYWLFWSRTRYASAWFKNFNKKYPYSGFIRLWDFGPWRINNKMLDELNDILQKRIELIDPKHKG